MQVEPWGICVNAEGHLKKKCMLLQPEFLCWDSVVVRYERKIICVDFPIFPLHPILQIGTVQADHLLISCLGDYYQRTKEIICVENKPGRGSREIKQHIFFLSL